MGKQYPQTEEARMRLSNPAFAYITYVREDIDKDHVFTKDELIAHTGYSDRAIRNQLAEIANYYPIIATSDKKGYRLLSFDESTSFSQLIAMYDEADHQLAELQSRIDALKARMKPLIAFKTKVNEEMNDRS